MKKIILLTVLLNSIFLFSQTRYKCFKNLQDPKLKIEIKEDNNSKYFRFKETKDYTKLVLINGEVTDNMDLVSTFADDENFDEKTNYLILYKFEDFSRESILTFITYNKKIYNFFTDYELQGQMFREKPCFD